MKLRLWSKCFAAALLLVLAKQYVLAQSLHFKTTEVEYNNQPVNVEVEYNNQPVNVRLLHQDHEGFIWLGTSQGLLRYTGTLTSCFMLPETLLQLNNPFLLFTKTRSNNYGWGMITACWQRGRGRNLRRLFITANTSARLLPLYWRAKTKHFR